MKIENIQAVEASDSRKRPTLDVSVNGEHFLVPSGASTGSHEALELRDTDGVGVTQAINNVNEVIASELVGKTFASQQELDQALISLDGTDNKSRLGANAILGVSGAFARASAKEKGVELWQYLQTLSSARSTKVVPNLYMNLVNGGLHAKTKLAFQEYHIVPQVADVSEALEIGKNILEKLREIVVTRYGEERLIFGDEGGIALPETDVEVPLQLLAEVCDRAGLGSSVRFALDVAASSFFKEGVYQIGEQYLTSEEMHELYKRLIGKYNLLSVEDPFAEEDFSNFAKLQSDHPELVVVGDDLTVTNVGLIEKAISQKSISGVIIKMNQIGTVTETVRAIDLAHKNNIKCIVSHRSGETLDTFIADLAYAFQVFGLKSGAPHPKERLVKYDRLIQICNPNHR